MADGATGVDVSWLHHTHKDYHQRPKPNPSLENPEDHVPPRSKSSSAPNGDVAKAQGSKTPLQVSTKHVNGSAGHTDQSSPQLGASPKQHHGIIRPLLRSRSSNTSMDRVSRDATGNASPTTDQGGVGARVPGNRRNSWISSLSSKFVSGPQSPPLNPTKEPPNLQKKLGSSPKTELANPFDSMSQPINLEDKTSVDSRSQQHKPQNTSFLTSAFRRLSSSGPGGLGRFAGSGPPVQRRVLNVDPNRERCKVPDLEKAKLKRVAFCVDVEIAGYANTRHEDGDGTTARPVHRPGSETSESEGANKKTKEAKLKDMGEGAALKDPKMAEQEKESDGIIKASKENVGTSDNSKPEGVILTAEPQTIPATAEASTTKKKEKKKRSEAERKERKERRRRLAEANGDVPLEFTRDDDDDDSSLGTTPPGSSTPVNGKPQLRPTTDPLRIYKRCAQLRETPALKKILDQISTPACTLAEAPGTVTVVDLTGVWMKMPDIVTLGDWLAVVPVRKLILENCGLTDEAVKILLSGLLACKSPDQARHNRKLAKKADGQSHGQELLGIIEKVSLKDNPKITRLGWEHIGLFMHLSRSLKSMDVSGIPFPKANNKASAKVSDHSADAGDSLCALISKGLAKRFGGDRLEELIMNQCSLSAHNVSNIVDGAIACGLRRLGLAANEFESEAVVHVVRYVKSRVCEGLDLAGNHLHGALQQLAEALDENNPLFALSLEACDIETDDLSFLLPRLITLPNFRFIDLSQNRSLFASQPNALKLLRKYLPRFPILRRIHLNDVDMKPDDAIGLAEILPECRMLAHIGLLENRELAALATAQDNVSQEEAMAVYTSLMTAVRCSDSIVAIEVETPSPDSNEVVKAVASQILAFSLRNLERLPLTVSENDQQIPSGKELSKSAPEILLHLVGHMEGYDEQDDTSEAAPDEDYYISATGVVKALGVCLGTTDRTSRRSSRDGSPSVSGTVTPRRLSEKSVVHKRPKDMSRELLQTARKLRARLRPALIKEDREGNDTNYRRLQFLDSTLKRIILRFEEEYPETRSVPPSVADTQKSIGESSSLTSSIDALSASVEDSLSKSTSYDEDRASIENENDEDPYTIKLSRTSSNTSLKTRALVSEEGRMHRFGQQFRREILRPEGLDYAHGTDETTVDPPHLAVLRAKLNTMDGNELRAQVLEKGFEKVVEEFGANAEELAQLEKKDPEGFQKLKEAQFAALANKFPPTRDDSSEQSDLVLKNESISTNDAAA